MPAKHEVGGSNPLESAKGETMDHLVEEMACPVCETKLDGATNTSGGHESPTFGDITVCIVCTQLLQYTENELVAYSLDKLEEEDKRLVLLMQESIRGSRH